jgi:arginyl-tRNA synthetase
VVDTEQEAQSEARLALITATKIVFSESLSLLGVSAPERM